MSATRATVTAACLCGDLGGRHRMGVRAGVPFRASCKDCGCEAFEPYDHQPDRTGPEQAQQANTIAGPGDGSATGAQPPGRQIPKDSGVAAAARRRGRVEQIAALVAERYAPGPATDTWEDRVVRHALATALQAAPQDPRRVQAA